MTGAVGTVIPLPPVVGAVAGVFGRPAAPPTSNAPRPLRAFNASPAVPFGENINDTAAIKANPSCQFSLNSAELKSPVIAALIPLRPSTISVVILCMVGSSIPILDN